MSDSGKEHTGELDFSDGELAEMGVEIVGRDAAPQPRRSRSMLRIPVDEVPRPQPEAARAMSSTEPSMPSFGQEGDAADDVVDHAFRNGGTAEGIVPAAVRLLAAPLKDELEAFSAQLFAERDRVLERHRAADVEEVEAEPDDDTDPKALRNLRAEEAARARAEAAQVATPEMSAGAIPQPVDDAPTRELAMSLPFGAASPPPGSTRPMSPALAALARAVAAPSDGKGDWLSSPTQAAGAPASVDARVAAVAAAFIEPELDVSDDDDEMELDGAELEDVEPVAPPPKPRERTRTLTPIQPANADDVEGVTAALLAVTAAPTGPHSTLPPLTQPAAAPASATTASARTTAPSAAASPAARTSPPATGTPLPVRTTPPAGQATHPGGSTNAAPGSPPTQVAPSGVPAQAAPGGPPAHAAPTGSPTAPGQPTHPASGQPHAAPGQPHAAPGQPHAAPGQPPHAAPGQPPHATPAHPVTPPPTPAGAPPATPHAQTSPPAVAAPPPVPAAPPPMPMAASSTQAHPLAPPATPPTPPAAAAVPMLVPAGNDAPLRPRRKRRAKQWFEEIFDDDYLRTLPFLTPRQTEREAQFIHESLQLPPGGAMLDLACGYGRHAMELAAKSYKVTGLDLSLPLLIRAADAARRVGVNVNFIHGDMREMTFEDEFDAAYCMFTSFGYFDDDTNRKVAANLARAIKPGGKLLIDVVNRDYLCRDLPTRVWWQGDGCVVLEEVDFNYFSSRLQVQRSIIFEDGRQLEQEISIRAYSLHEIGKVLHHSGFRVTEVSGGLSLRGKFFGANSRQLIVVAEKKLTP